MFTQYNLYIQGSFIVMNPHGHYGLTSPGKSRSNINSEFRDLFIPLELLDPTRETELKKLLNNYFQLQLKPEHINAYADHFHQVLLAKESSLTVTCAVKKIAPTSERFRNLMTQSRETNREVTYLMTPDDRKTLANFFDKNPQQSADCSQETRLVTINYLDEFFGFSKTLAILDFEAVNTHKSFYANLVLLDLPDQKSAAINKLIELHRWRLAQTQNHLDHIIADMRAVVEFQYSNTSKLINIVNQELDSLAKNPLTYDMTTLFFKTPDMRMVIANNADVSDFYLESNNWVKPYGTYRANTKTIYVAHNPNYLYPPQDCGFTDINRAGDNTAVCFTAVLHDELTHAAINILHQVHSPSQINTSSTSYLKAIESDQVYLQRLKSNKEKNNAQWQKFVTKTKKQFQETLPKQRQLVINAPEVVGKLTSKDVGRTITYQIPDEPPMPATIRQVIPPCAFSETQMVIFTLPPMDKLTEDSFARIAAEAVADAERSFSIEAEYRNSPNDEIISRNLRFKWGELTKHLTPNLYRFIEDTIVTAAKNKLALQEITNTSIAQLSNSNEANFDDSHPVLMRMVSPFESQKPISLALPPSPQSRSTNSAPNSISPSLIFCGQAVLGAIAFLILLYGLYKVTTVTFQFFRQPSKKSEPKAQQEPTQLQCNNR